METPSKVRCLFGTDGVRDVANKGIMTPEMAMKLGRAFILYLTENGIPRPKIAVGKDTRRSGAMLDAALTSGMASAGAEVYNLGVFPTPGVSFTVRNVDFDGGAVISASHNPAEYNGIKFVDKAGYKLTDEAEATIEEYLGDNLMEDWRPTGASVGDMYNVHAEYRDKYLEWLKGFLGHLGDAPWPVVVDSANGAAALFSEEIFRSWGAPVTFCGIKPDGLNINEGVGVMHMPHLISAVRESKSVVGIAYDGDADRVLLCDSKGRVIDGDIMLWIMGKWMASQNKLGSGVVATVMSNIVLEEKLGESGVKVFRCQVGDRYVLEAMQQKGANLGGEQSGHIIASEFVNTGDGLFTGLLFLRACQELGEDISSLVDNFPRYPQVLKNVQVRNRDAVLGNPELADAVSAAENTLGSSGRLVLRPSGTEPLIRILVEARDAAVMDKVCTELASTIIRLGEPI